MPQNTRTGYCFMLPAQIGSLTSSLSVLILVPRAIHNFRQWPCTLRRNTMKIRYALKLGALSLAVLAWATFAPSASASVIGHLTLANCGGGGVVVTLTTIDFELPPLGGNGCIMTGLGTTVTFTGGTGVITSNEAGTVNDLGFPPPLSGNTGFISFPGVTFDLLAVGAGVANTACTNTYDPTAPACAVVLGSPFVVTSGRHSTTIAFYVSGVTNDASSVHDPWTG